MPGAGTRQRFLIEYKNAHTLMFFSNYSQTGVSKRAKMKIFVATGPPVLTERHPESMETFLDVWLESLQCFFLALLASQ